VGHDGTRTGLGPVAELDWRDQRSVDARVDAFADTGPVLVDAVVIPEAAIKSGSLHTAGFALDLGKPVLAVPGSIYSETSAGTNQLLKTGATPLTRVQDIFDALGLKGAVKQQSFEGMNPQEIAILEALQRGANQGVQLLEASRLKTQEFAQTLTMLEVTGRIRSLGGDQWSLS